MSDPDLTRIDPLVLGKRIRFFRTSTDLTLAQLADQLGVSISTLSLIETGKRLPRVELLKTLAHIFGLDAGELVQDDAPDERSSLELEILQFQSSEAFTQLGIAPLKLSSRLPDDILRTVAGLYTHIARTQAQRQATPEEARMANKDLREDMRRRDNYFPEIERSARELLTAVEYSEQSITAHKITQMADYLGFRLVFTGELPHSTRSVIDLEFGRIFLPGSGMTLSNKTRALQALGHIMLAHKTPKTYANFLRQRVEINYFAAAVLMPEELVVPQLHAGRSSGDISIDDLRERFGVSFETAAHRFTNLITQHLQIPVHFMRVHETGLVYKAYENDGLQFPRDNAGAIEGQRVCRFWSARQVFEQVSPGQTYAQWSDLPDQSYWCASHLEETDRGKFSITLGFPEEYAQLLRGPKNTQRRLKSGCPGQGCCVYPPRHLSDKWRGKVWPSASVPSHLLAAIPPGMFPGVDDTEVFEFLEEQAR